MWSEDLQFAFYAARDENVAVAVDRDTDWPLGHRPRHDTTFPRRLDSVYGTVLVVRHVQPPASHVTYFPTK